MKFSAKVMMLFLMTAFMFSYNAFATEQEEGQTAEEKCLVEARAAGMVNEEEKHDYVAQCVEELSMQEDGEDGDSDHASHE